jgi:hypothetical protein
MHGNEKRAGGQMRRSIGRLCATRFGSENRETSRFLSTVLSTAEYF